MDSQQAAPMEDRSFTLPPYPKLIMEAIEASKDAKGCSKTAITDHIESTQECLPPSNTTLINYHLNQMKHSGQIVMVKDKYMKPDLVAPPKRGRGRPPKPKPTQVEPSQVAVSPSPPRPRGRPPKKPKTEVEAPAPQPNGEPRRGRGRPPKVKPEMVPA